ncbi:unnamed protein product, partial [Staurois parvus]
APRHLWPWLSITRSRPVIPHRHPVISKYLRWRRNLYVNNTDLSRQLLQLLCMALHSKASVKQTQPT